jgi:hypothetical protein
LNHVNLVQSLHLQCLNDLQVNAFEEEQDVPDVQALTVEVDLRLGYLLHMVYAMQVYIEAFLLSVVVSLIIEYVT